MNKSSLGLHSWGNVVPCCKKCNNEKQQKYWLDFLKIKSQNELDFISKKARIEEFVIEMNINKKLTEYK